jgi:sugar/nucleoside kinase (ribokinase family)
VKPILVAGELNVDLILSGIGAMPVLGGEVLAEDFRQMPGSSSMICAMGLARLGEAVGFVGRAGRDERGEYCVHALSEAGIDVAAVRRDGDLATGVTVALSSRADRALVTFPGSIDALEAADVTDELLACAGHLHVSSYYLQRRLRPRLRELFARAHAAGLTTSLDPGFDPEQRWGDDIVGVLGEVDVFLPNRLEACAISGKDTVEAALRALTDGPACVVVKCGGEGCIALDGDEILHVPAFTVTPLDSTGAGDSFDAGFLHAWRRQLPLRECLRWASACGSLATRGIGGTASQASVIDVMALLGASR